MRISVQSFLNSSYPSFPDRSTYRTHSEF